MFFINLTLDDPRVDVRLYLKMQTSPSAIVMFASVNKGLCLPLALSFASRRLLMHAGTDCCSRTFPKRRLILWRARIERG
jgi:hypothetical protein